MTQNPITKKQNKSLNIDAPLHVRGETHYLDDIPELAGTLYARACYSKIAHGIITKLDFSKAEAFPGVVRILTYKDIPGENQIGGIIPDEPLLAEKEVHFIGQAILIVLAIDEVSAYKATQLVEIEIQAKKVIIDPIEAFQNQQFLSDPMVFQIGDAKKTFDKCAYIFEDEVQSGGQEHVYLEPQGAYAIPQDNGCLKILSSTQGPTAVQRTVAKVLGISMNKIEVDVSRLGGGFGGKEDQASG